MKAFKLSFIVALIATFACNKVASQNVLEADKFEATLSKKQDAQLIDVRTAEEYTSGHIANAANFNVDGPDFKTQVGKLDKNKPTFVYCLAGGRSANAAKILADMGFTEVYDLKNGFRAWSKAGKPVVTGDVKAGDGNVTATAATTAENGAGMTKASLEELIKDKKYVLVDFSAKWCGPCKVMSPVLDKIGKEMSADITIIKIDVDENPLISDEFKVEALPTLVYFNGTKVIGRTLGWNGEADLRANIASYSKLAK